MRHYPRNSPQSAARLVALAMMADGHVGQDEWQALERADTERALGLAPGELGRVMQALCEDLLQVTLHQGTLDARLDDELLRSLYDEIDDPALRGRVLATVMLTAAADGHFADGERRLLEDLRRHWLAPQFTH